MVLEIVQEGIQEAIEIREVVVLLAVQSIIVLEIVVHHVDLVQGGRDESTIKLSFATYSSGPDTCCYVLPIIPPR